MKFKVGYFNDGRLEAEVHTPGTSFPLRNGGANKIMCHVVYDLEQAIAFVPSLEMAAKIADLLNDEEYSK